MRVSMSKMAKLIDDRMFPPAPRFYRGRSLIDVLSQQMPSSSMGEGGVGVSFPHQGGRDLTSPCQSVPLWTKLSRTCRSAISTTFTENVRPCRLISTSRHNDHNDRQTCASEALERRGLCVDVRHQVLGPDHPVTLMPRHPSAPLRPPWSDARGSAGSRRGRPASGQPPGQPDQHACRA
jgi:hypothetical protein